LASLSWSGVGLRTGVIAGALVVWFWTQSLIARKAAAKDGIGDVVHDLTSRWHLYLSMNKRAANAALILSSICNDLIGLALIDAGHFGRTWLALLAAVIALGEMLIVLVLRAHYTLDVVAGAFAAFLAADVAGRLSPAVNAWLQR